MPTDPDMFSQKTPPFNQVFHSICKVGGLVSTQDQVMTQLHPDTKNQTHFEDRFKIMVEANMGDSLTGFYFFF